MTFLDHLGLLRRHLWFSVLVLAAGFCISLLFYVDIIRLLTEPLAAASGNTGGGLYLTTVYEGFMAGMRISLTAGFVFTLPLHILNMLVFVFPAMTSGERRSVSLVLAAGSLLIVISVYYGYRFLIPFSVQFLTGSRFMAEGVSWLLGFTRNIFYIVQFFAALVIIFQLPLLMLILIGMRVISVGSAFRNGRYIVVGAFVLSAVLTPPDIASQIATALPLIILYYLALGIALLFRLGEA